MSFNYAGSDAGKAATLALFTGIIEFIMGFLNLGNTKLLETVLMFKAIPSNLFIKDCPEGFIINSFPFSRLKWWRTEGLLLKENEQLLPFFLADIETFCEEYPQSWTLDIDIQCGHFWIHTWSFHVSYPCSTWHHWITWRD